MIYFFILLIGAVVLYALFYPRTDTIYKDNKGNQVIVLDMSKTIITIQSVNYNSETNQLTELTEPQNITLWKFLKTYDLWIML